jgi:uncharacterized repeat protein (TIGR01451 family)
LGDDVVSAIDLIVGHPGSGYDFGELVPASLSGVVVNDLDADGVPEDGEPGIGGVAVTLTGTDDLDAAVSITVLTDAAGQFRFDGLRPGTYTVTEAQPAGYLDGPDTAGSAGGVVGDDSFSSIILTPGADGTGYRFAEFEPVSIAGTVWLDGDASTTEDAGEPGEPGVPVTLRRDDDGDGIHETVIATTATDADGNYAFLGLPPGSYLVEVATPPGMTATTPDSVLVSAGAGQDVTDVDVGLVTGTVDLALTKDVVGDVVVGAPATWLITVTNPGSVTIDGPMTVTDTLPAGTAYIGTTTPAWTCSAVGPVVTCTHPTPPAPGASTGLGLIVDVTPAAASPLRNQADVVVRSGEVAMDNNVDDAVAPVLAAPTPSTTTTTTVAVAGSEIVAEDGAEPASFVLPVTGWSVSGRLAMLLGLTLLAAGMLVLTVRRRSVRRP